MAELFSSFCLYHLNQMVSVSYITWRSSSVILSVVCRQSVNFSHLDQLL